MSSRSPGASCGAAASTAAHRCGSNGLRGHHLLWQHLFWFFGRPEVRIIALPFFDIVTKVIPVFTRKLIITYVSLIAAPAQSVHVAVLPCRDGPGAFEGQTGRCDPSA